VGCGGTGGTVGPLSTIDPPPPPPPPPEWADQPTRQGAEPRHARRRRSALRTPALVDRMDVADDADGRVAIFSVAEPRRASQIVSPPPRPDETTAPTRLGQMLDSPYAVVVIAGVLVVILVLGLMFSRH
jgi:hypothetical protein